MMIKALILVHLWSLVVAGIAWVLQRDGSGRVGARFPAPHIWLTLIVLSLLPGALYLMPFGAAINLPKIDALDLFLIPINDSAAVTVWSPDYLLVYVGLATLLLCRTLWRWSQLQRLPIEPIAEPDIFTTTAALPPLTLSWPRRAIVIPPGFEHRSALIRHERAHLDHHDAEFTLLFLLLQDMMLRNPGIGYLVRQWRLAIELRADHSATKTLTISERKDYAALLLNIQRPIGNGTRTLPCPTASLNSTGHRNAKMRLVEILEKEPKTIKRRWASAVLLTSIGATTLGLTSAIATVDTRVIDMGSSPINYVKQTSLQLPSHCPGLIGDLKKRGLDTEEKETTINGQLISQKTLKIGTVVLGHDVRRDGGVTNLRVIASTHPCFEANAKVALAQWKAEPQGSEIKNVVVKLNFGILGATNEELNQQLRDLVQ